MSPNQGLKLGILRNAGWNLSAVVLQIVLGILSARFLVRGFGESQYGAYAILGTIIGMLEFANLGLGEATFRFVSFYHARGDKPGISRVLGATLSVQCTLGLFACACVGGFAPLIVGRFSIPAELLNQCVLAVRIVCLGSVVGMAGGILTSVAGALQRFDISSKVQMALGVSSATALVCVGAFGGTIVTASLVFLVRMTLSLFIGFGIARRLLPDVQLTPKPSVLGLREVFGYGVFSFVNQVIGWGVSNIDRLILGMFFRLEDVTSLSIPKQMLDQGGSAVSSISQVLLPRFSNDDSQSAKGNTFLEATWVLSAFAIIVFVPVTILMREILSLWISPEFAAKSTLTAQLVSACMATRGCYAVYFEFLKGTARVSVMSTMLLCTSALGLIVAVPLLLKFGLIGAGYRMWVTAWAGFLATVFVWKFYLSGPIPRIIGAMVEPLIVGTVTGALIYAVRSSAAVPTWVGLVFWWGATSLCLLGSLLVVNYISQGKRGPGFKILSRGLRVFER